MGATVTLRRQPQPIYLQSFEWACSNHLGLKTLASAPYLCHPLFALTTVYNILFGQQPAALVYHFSYFCTPIAGVSSLLFSFTHMKKTTSRTPRVQDCENTSCLWSPSIVANFYHTLHPLRLKRHFEYFFLELLVLPKNFQFSLTQYFPLLPDPSHSHS